MDGPSESIESAKCKKNENHSQYWKKNQGRKNPFPSHSSWHTQIDGFGSRLRLSRMVYRPFETNDDVPQEAFFSARRRTFPPASGSEWCPFPNGWVSFAQVCSKFVPSCAVRQGALRSLSWRLGVDGTQIVQLFAPAWTWKPDGKMTPVCCIVSRRLHLGNLLSKLLILESLFCNCILG